MASPFYNRLVGVTILVASVVIFLPSIIDGKKTAYKDEIVAMPIKPLLKPHRQETQQALKNMSVTSSSTAIVREEMSTIEIENNQWEIQEVAPTVTVGDSQEINTQPINSEKSLTQESAWTIQLGAFQNAQNINLLLKKLNKAGFQVHTVPVEVIDGDLTRVFVGPDVSKIKLEKQLPQLKSLTKLQGKLLPFNAINP